MVLLCVAKCSLEKKKHYRGRLQDSYLRRKQGYYIYVNDISIYESSFYQGFELFYGKPSDYCILALLPNYLERKGSSLVYMFDKLIQESQHP